MTATALLLVLLVLVTVAVGAYVLWPLLSRPAAPAGTDAAADVDAAGTALAVLRERRRELELALAHLPADAPERRAALVEFAALAEAELPSAPAAVAAPGPAPVKRRPVLAAAIAALLALPTFALYLLAGAPEAASPEFRSARDPATLDELAADLRRRLQADPGQTEGWRLLGRAELARGRPDDARQAFERALALAPADVSIRVDLADAIAQSQGAVLEGRPIELIREALAADPRHPKGLALAGAYEVARRDLPAALRHWRTLLDVLPADSEQRLQIAGFVADLEAGRLPQVAAASSAGPGTTPSAAPGATPPAGPVPPIAAPSVQPADPAARPTPDAPGGPAAAIAGRIDVERRLAERVRAEDTVFVVARTVDDAGRPAGPPVAVLRARGADLPLAFSLDDRMAMSPAARLSTVPEGTRVVVVVRVSRTGEAAARTGDLQGASPPVRPGASGLRVLVDTVVE